MNHENSEICDGLWLFSGSICWKRLENSVIFSYHFILLYTVCSSECGKASCRSETKRFVLSVEYRNYPSCRDLSNLSKTCRKFQLHVLRWISRVFFLDEKHIPSGFGNEANRGAATLQQRGRTWSWSRSIHIWRQGRSFRGAFGFPLCFFNKFEAFQIC